MFYYKKCHVLNEISGTTIVFEKHNQKPVKVHLSTVVKEAGLTRTPAYFIRHYR
jgi:hypothetical protein